MYRSTVKHYQGVVRGPQETRKQKGGNFNQEISDAAGEPGSGLM